MATMICIEEKKMLSLYGGGVLEDAQKACSVKNISIKVGKFGCCPGARIRSRRIKQVNPAAQVKA